MRKNNTIRDNKIVEMYQSGLSAGKISKLVGLTRGRVGCILRDCGISVKNNTGIDISGVVFGSWTVLHASEEKYATGGNIRWVCQCVCGITKNVLGSSLRNGYSKSCGCGINHKIIHGFDSGGYTKHLPLRMLRAAKHRAKRDGIPFKLELSDIVIPEFCPVFTATRLENKGYLSDNSPTLDRLIPELGYVRGNVRVISHKANSMKRNATAQEIRQVADWLDSQLYPV